MSGRDGGGRVPGRSDGVILTWTPRTPLPSRWVVVDEEVFLDGVDDGWMGFELGWAPDGTEDSGRRFATFETSDCLTSALLAVEDVRVTGADAVVTGAGFGGRVTSRGVTTWSLTTPDGGEARLEHGSDEVAILWRGPGRSTWDLVASASSRVAREDLAAYGDPVLTALVVVVAAFRCTTEEGYLGR